MSLIPSDNSQAVAQNLRVIWVYEFHNTTELGRVAAIVAASKADGLMVKMVKSDWPHFSRWHDELAIKLRDKINSLKELVSKNNKKSS